ncbi:MAG: hypothetical protein JWO30_1868 [Fibrobacteres bacterium]|nr:hypothetical protein [Fibrobacterota bacterium]
MKPFEYIYYRIYSWNLKKWGVSNMPHINALYLVSLMMFQNLYALALIAQFFGIDFALRTPLPEKEAIVTAFTVVVFNYFHFIRKGQYKSLAKKYSHELPNERRRNAVFVWIYMVMSLLSILILAFAYKSTGPLL